jgi:hypothetical protein
MTLPWDLVTGPKTQKNYQTAGHHLNRQPNVCGRPSTVLRSLILGQAWRMKLSLPRRWTEKPAILEIPQLEKHCTRPDPFQLGDWYREHIWFFKHDDNVHEELYYIEYINARHHWLNPVPYSVSCFENQKGYRLTSQRLCNTACTDILLYSARWAKDVQDTARGLHR